MDILLHICCGVCAIGLVKKFRQNGYQITGYFYNPNIHPSLEFQKRLRAVEILSEREKIQVVYERDYGLIEFLITLTKDIPVESLSNSSQRCPKCYELRLSKTAEFARQNNFSTFSSTLIISPQQNRTLIKNIGENIAQNYGISFKYEPITELYNETKELAKKYNLYRQQYCGCIFSEHERYHYK
jgi:predicted adenine nucleotide alpha hydrolase (AANH) superfamily ATPase